MKPQDNLTKRECTKSPSAQKGLPSLISIQHIFERNISEVENLSNALYLADKDIQEDILRAQVVFLCSTVDSYMHDIIAYGYIMMFYGEWSTESDFNRQRVKLSDFKEAYDNFTGRGSKDVQVIIKKSIVESIQYDTMMRFDAIKDSLAGIGIDSNRLDYLKEPYRNSIDSLVNLRNLIVHRSGRKVNTKPNKEEISSKCVLDYIDKVKKMQNSIQSMMIDLDRQKRQQ